MNFQAWRDRAECRGEEIVKFFGPEGETPAAKKARERDAKEVCSWCEVRAECLEFAVDGPEKYGIYGGLTEEERRAIHRNGLRRARKLQAVS